jgi:hypothetical protein
MGNCCQKTTSVEEPLLLHDTKPLAPRPFTPVAYNVDCSLCGAAIASQFETRKDARGRPFHAQCCRCGRCGRALSGDTVCIRDGKAFCRLHASPERVADVVAATPGASVAEEVKTDTAHVDVADLCEAMIDKIVMMPPTCVSCGGIFGAKVFIYIVIFTFATPYSVPPLRAGRSSHPWNDQAPH